MGAGGLATRGRNWIHTDGTYLQADAASPYQPNATHVTPVESSSLS